MTSSTRRTRFSLSTDCGEAAGEIRGLRALSIQQPWVHAILHLGKDVENRTWSTKCRGWIALHASARPRAATDDDFPRGIRCPDLDLLEYSAILGVARLVDVRERSRSKWTDRPEDGSINYSWLLADPIALKKPISCNGKLGLWKVSPNLVRSIVRQLPKSLR